MQKRRVGWGWRVAIFLLLLVIAYCAWALLRPLPDIQPSQTDQSLKFTTRPPQLSWPSQGQSAVSILSTIILEIYGNQTPAPTASTAKVITALLVLQKHPLTPGQTGPLITLTAADVARY